MLATGLGSLSSALVAGGAVLAGVLVTSFTQIRVERRKERREHQRAVSRREEELRLAVRLAAFELTSAEHLLREATRSGQYWSGDHQLSTQSWVEQRTTLAGQLPGPADWDCVTEAYQEVDRINRMVSERRRHSARDEVSLGTDDTLTSWRIIMHAIGVLQATSGDWYDVSHSLEIQANLERNYWGVKQQ
jgi:hypothetical protein